MTFYAHIGGSDWIALTESEFCRRLRIAHTHDKGGDYLRFNTHSAQWQLKTKGAVPDPGSMDDRPYHLPVQEPVLVPAWQ